ncbi:hypothetical protein ACQ4M3_09450 [Leptolyngbya sp. AN03gr2]|uniref:hypothetical protein n=1 Tax=Leptolyngbya sp. AN03gr2 TaxID=3423364 RepID=UPI003D3127DC
MVLDGRRLSDLTEETTVNDNTQISGANGTNTLGRIRLLTVRTFLATLFQTRNSKLDSVSGLANPVSPRTLTLNADGTFTLSDKADLVSGQIPATQARASTISYNSTNGVITYTDARGTVTTLDLPIENLFQNAAYNSGTQTLTLTTNGGGTINVSLAQLVDLPEIVVATADPGTTPTTGQRLYLRSDTGEYWISNGSAWLGRFLAFTSAERTKLTGIATGATANNTDAQLRDRSTHTGSQAISTVAGLQTALDVKQELNSRLSAISSQANPATARTIQLQPDGSVAFVDPVAGDGQPLNARLSAIANQPIPGINQSLRLRADTGAIEFYNEPNTSGWQTVFQDDFNRANGTVGNGWTISNGTGTIAIDGNQLRLNRSGGEPWAVNGAATIDGEIFVTWVASASYGVTALSRVQGTNTWYGVGVGEGVQNSFGINRFVNGVFSGMLTINLTSAIVLGQTYELRMRVQGANPTVLTAEIRNNSGIVISTGTNTVNDSSAALQTAGRRGVTSAANATGFVDSVVLRDFVTVAGGGGGAVASVFGRAGAVAAQSGDYNSDQITEGTTNLFHTLLRAQTAARSAISVTGSGSYNSATGVISISAGGGGSVTGSAAVSTIADLKALTVPANGTMLTVLGYYAINDCRVRTYRYNSTSTATDNGGSIIAPNSGVGRYELIPSGSSFSFREFGARGDGAQDDTTAIRNCITAAAARGLAVEVDPTLTYYSTRDQINLPANTFIYGYGWRSAIRAEGDTPNPVTPSDPGDNIILRPKGNNVTIKNLRLFGRNPENLYYPGGINQANSGNGVHVNGNQEDVENLVIEDCVFHNFKKSAITIGAKAANIRIRNNFCFANQQAIDDISVTGPLSDTTFVSRVQIINNFCLSNSNGSGINCNQDSTHDILISGNIIMALTADGQLVTSSMNAPASRRHGIHVAYGTNAGAVGGLEQRIVISNNIIRNCAWTGIYSNDQFAGDPSIQQYGPYVITGNIISDIGTISNNESSISGGIAFLGGASGTTITGNTFIRCGTASNPQAAIKIWTAFTIPNKKYAIVGNCFKECGIGIILGRSFQNVEVQANTFEESFGNDIYVDQEAGASLTCRSSISNNKFHRNNTNSSSISIGATLLGELQIVNNTFYGHTAGTNVATNTGINIPATVSEVIIEGNFFTRFWRGINFASVSTAPNSFMPAVRYNKFRSINGVALDAQAGTGLILSEGNVFDSGIATPIGSRVVYGTRIHRNNIEYHVTAIPTFGIDGDMAINVGAAVGQPAEWRRVGGTWRSQGNVV